ncbi:MAG: Ferrichrome iron receptor [Nitrospira sp.]|nr:MAG: Ferrichrome iron receptor [Nitrospira sp.]
MLIMATQLLSLIILTASLSGCTQISGDRKFSAAKPSSPAACHEPMDQYGYVAACVSGSPIETMPYSTHVITRPVIVDQKALTLGDALRNVSGVQSSR